jgi:2-keto-4-pentenoate hydratase/2-oxohepta-3-ene-1,7-dioic acid hydratase in catechol pathway
MTLNDKVEGGILFMFESIRNIYCIGRNYRAHAAELGNAVPSRPMLFSKPTHSLVPWKGDIVLPGGRGEIHYETELVIRIGESIRSGREADRAIDGIAFGIDFTLRDLQSELKRAGHPWLAAKGFPNSAPITEFLPFPGTSALAEKDFALWKNGGLAQRGNVRGMIFGLQEIIDFTALHFGLGPGDLIFTGTPEGVGPVRSGDLLEVHWGGERLGSARFVLES